MKDNAIEFLEDLAVLGHSYDDLAERCAGRELSECINSLRIWQAELLKQFPTATTFRFVRYPTYEDDQTYTTLVAMREQTDTERAKLKNQAAAFAAGQEAAERAQLAELLKKYPL